MSRTELVHRALRSSHQQCVSMARRENSQRIHGHRGYTLHSRHHPNNPHHIIPPACPQHSVEGIQMSAERARSGRLELLWLPKTPGRNLRHAAAIFVGKRGQMSSEQLRKWAAGHSASTRLMQMKEQLPAQAAVSQPPSRRSDWFQLMEPVPTHGTGSNSLQGSFGK